MNVGDSRELVKSVQMDSVMSVSKAIAVVRFLLRRGNGRVFGGALSGNGRRVVPAPAGRRALGEKWEILEAKSEDNDETKAEIEPVFDGTW